MLHAIKWKMILALTLSILVQGCSILPNFGVKQTYIPAGMVAELREPISVPIWAHDKNGIPYKSVYKAWPGDLIGPVKPVPTSGQPGRISEVK